MPKMIRHMSTNIEGLLRNMKGKKINFIQDDFGNTMSDAEARAEIAKLQAKGHKLIPSGDCEGFDPFGKGCPGHPVEETCFMECISCNEQFDIDVMKTDDTDNHYCEECWTVLAPQMKADYEESIKKGEIDQ